MKKRGFPLKISCGLIIFNRIEDKNHYISSFALGENVFRTYKNKITVE
jgi:hypothetical protein